jgi:predicted phage gp36 major capsid-like protein
VEEAERKHCQWQVKIKRSSQRVAGYTTWPERDEKKKVGRHCAYYLSGEYQTSSQGQNGCWMCGGKRH